jgi:hypothetical protein
MKSRSLLILAAVALAGLAAYWHVTVNARLAPLDRSGAQASRKRQQTDAEIAGLLARIASDHARLRALMTGPAEPAKPPARSEVATPPAASLSGDARMAKIGGDPQLRELDIKAYVDSQRLKYGKLGLTAEQLQKFDAIQAEYEGRVLDLAIETQAGHLAPNDPALAAKRQQIAQMQDAELQELFGPAYAQWKEDNIVPPERMLVAQVAQLALGGSGNFPDNEVGQLTSIVMTNRRPGTYPTMAASYDWDAIAAQATAILNPEQDEGFKNGIEIFLAESRMRELTAKAAGN